MEVPASTKLSTSTTCWCLPSGSAGTVEASSAHPSGPLAVVHAALTACASAREDRGYNQAVAGFSRWCAWSGGESDQQQLDPHRDADRRDWHAAPGYAASSLVERYGSR